MTLMIGNIAYLRFRYYVKNRIQQDEKCCTGNSKWSLDTVESQYKVKTKQESENRLIIGVRVAGFELSGLIPIITNFVLIRTNRCELFISLVYHLSF